MKMLVCMAGLPYEVAEEVKGLSAAVFTEDKDNTPIVKPIKPPYAFRDGMSEAYLNELAERISELNPREDAAVLLVYVAYEGEATLGFLKRFFPFALAAPLDPFYPDRFPKHERRKALRNYVDNMKTVVERLRGRAHVVRDVFSGQNFTPLLLPLRNFHSDVLAAQIEELFYGLGTIEDPRDRLERSKQAILAQHPLHRLASHTPFFQDNRQLRFKSPGKNRHGMARLIGEGHDHRCLIGARVRLGGPFDPLFHYDCEYERRNVDKTYANCHGASAEPAVKTHVNIAPSDAIR
jgi:hypothetical protein